MRQPTADAVLGCQVSAADFTPERIAELRSYPSNAISRNTTLAMLKAIEELQAEVQRLRPLAPEPVPPKTEADFTPEKLAEIAADLMGPRR